LADPARPFVVRASSNTVTALGAAFNVDVEKEGAHVTAMKHRMTVESGGEDVIVAEDEKAFSIAGWS
jgi:ferric-dicitrate binding protein FerR (iron transport regulator)